MTALTTTRARPVAAQPTGRPDSPVTPEIASQTVRKIRDYRAPFVRFGDLRAEYPDWSRGLYEDLRNWGPNRSQIGRARFIQHVRGMVDVLPPRARLQALAPEIEEAATGKPRGLEVRGIVTFLIGAFPHAKAPEPWVYYETVLSELKVSGFSVPVIAEGCAQVVRTATFLPAVAEILTKCDDARKAASTAHHMLTKTAARLDELAAALTAAEAQTDLPAEEPRPTWIVKPAAREGEAA